MATHESDGVPVVDNPSQQRYEARIDGQLAVLTYRRSPGRITFLHTGVPPELEGHGIGTRLVQVALDAARGERLTVVPRCPFVADYIRQHPAYADLL